MTSNPSYVILEGMGLCCGLFCLKEWCQLCLPDFQFRKSYCEFLRLRRFSANRPAPLLAFWCLKDLLFQDFDIYWGIILIVDWKTWTIDKPRCVTFFFVTLLQLYDEITRSEMSCKNKCIKYLYSLSNGLIIGFKYPVFIFDVCRCKNPNSHM